MDKNEPSRFLGEGVSFKAKLIGILEVSEARGDRMCQEALADLKMAIRAAGEHKQRITINIAIDGLRLRDEKTGDSLYHHPVHKISFIAQDMSDSRAFGYIFGSPDTGHRFFGIKTDKAASQVVIAMRDLFQVVFELKKKEIELAKQHIEQKSRFSSTSAAALFSESAISNKSYQNGDSHTSSSKLTAVNETSSTSTSSTTKVQTTNNEGGAARPESAIADLVDLELELSSIQQGIHQMERITPSDPFGPNKDDPFSSDPFGDSFTTFPQKPFLPPPPSARDRPSRNTSTSDTSSMFSPKTPKSNDQSQCQEQQQSLFKTSHDEPSSCGWFTPTGGNDSLFEDALSLSAAADSSSTVEPEPEPDPTETTTKETNASILSQFDVFTELDPLGTGRSKPYIDKKLFFQELKNPPKKVLKDLVTETQPSEPTLFANFHQITTTATGTGTGTTGGPVFQTDPFADDDPFDKTDPFAESTETTDPFDTEFVVSKQPEKKLQTHDPIQPLFPLSKSPNRFTSTNTNTLTNDNKKYTKLEQLHENPSLDMSSESECAPEPPPRPTTSITSIKPPPLPPKKQTGDLAMKPPPRPPHTEESHYDYMDNYETGNLDSFHESPPLPVPARKSRFDPEYSTAPQRPKKHQIEDDYLQPIQHPHPQTHHHNSHKKQAGPILLPPPMKSSKRNIHQNNHVTVASYLESKPTTKSTTTTTTTAATTTADNKLNLTPDTLDITLSQLTLSGLNELASKLNIPASQLSNMTLVQLTSYLSNYVKTTTNVQNNDADATFPTFKADFSSNFNTSTNTKTTEPYDRYAVFRELLQQEKTIEQDEPIKADEPPPIKKEEKETKSTLIDSNKTDRYAALRDIVIEDTISEEKQTNLDLEDDNKAEDEQNDLNLETLKIDVDEVEVESNIIEYPAVVKTPALTKSPVPIAVTEIIHTSNHLTSGSVSDVVSGSSPEIDNGSEEVVTKKNVENITRESWAIFDTPNHNNKTKDKEKEKQQSEEGVSPWSSDSKEFGNGSPQEWQQPRDSGSEGEWNRQRRRERDGSWWDSQGEREGHYEKPSRIAYTRERRSTDSYDDEWYEPDRPRRRTRQQTSHGWSKTSIGGGGGGGERVGGERGQSSSSRDVSPWEEDEPRTRREREECWRECRRGRGPSWDRERHRRRDDSWDEEDDYEYEDEYISGKIHWPERHGSRDSDRASRDSDRRDPPDHWDSGGDQWPEERRHIRRRGHPHPPPQEDRWTRPDWEHETDMVCGTKEKVRYNSRWPNPNQESKWRERKREPDRYYKREHSQESPWEDDYSNDPDEPQSPRYLTARRNWKRPSSASEMDRKTGEIKSRGGAPYYMGTGGSDGERDRKYRANRRSRSRDSQFAEISSTHQRHKVDTSLTLGRYSHRNRDKYNQDFPQDKLKIEVKLDAKKSATLGRKKIIKELPSPKIENEPVVVVGGIRKHMMFENDFVNSETESTPPVVKTKFTFENEFETSEAESPVSRYPKTSPRGAHDPLERNIKSISFDNANKQEKNTQSQSQIKSQKSLFEDDFSPTDKPTTIPEDNNGITVIAEEPATETRVSFTENNLDKVPETRRQNKILSKSRIGNNRGDGHIKKSESVNIFARENDPFDDDFFSGHGDEVIIQKVENTTKLSPNNVTEFKWTEDFDSFDIPEEK